MKTKKPSSFCLAQILNHVSLVSRKEILFGFAFSISLICSAQTELIKDINSMQNTEDKEYSKAVNCNGIMYFNSNKELWRTNGKTSGTILLKRFHQLGDMISYAGAVYFYASQSGEGLELWRSTGASYSTVRLKDIRVGAGYSSEISQFTVSGKFLFFVANNGTNGKELWRTDGTSSGTMMVKDILAKGGSSNPAFLKDVNGLLYFAANDGINGYELWKSDGTIEGTAMVKDIRPGSRLSSSPAQITNVNGIAYFTAIDGVTGRELWKSDGTVAGTLLVKDFVPGPESRAYRNLTGVNNTLFFSANDKIHGEEVWKSDGTSAGTVMVKDLYPGGATKLFPGIAARVLALRNFTSIYGKLYFTGYGPDGYFFWKTDGTSAGTVPLKEAYPLGGAAVTAHFTPFNGSVIFCDGADGNEYKINYSYNLQKEDGTGHITTIATLFLNSFYDSQVPFLVHSGNLIYFTGRRTLDEGHALFKTAGTAASTQFLIDTFVASQSSDPKEFVKIGSNIYFKANSGATGLWKTDGTNAGTLLLKEMDGAGLQNLTNVNGQLFFAGFTFENDWSIYTSDGTPEGTTRIPLKFSGGAPLTMTNVNGKLIATFRSREIIAIEGSTINLFSVTPTIDRVFALGNYLYFRGTDSVNGSELWRTDGTPAGTKLIKDVNLNGNSDIDHFAALNGVLYFSANDGIHGYELWRSNGTASGTYLVTDIRTGDTEVPNLNDLSDIAEIANQIYFFALDQNSQPAIWKSNGTGANTLKVVNVPTLSRFAVSNNRMYFIATTSTGHNLWKSDGTAENTTQLAKVGATDIGSYVTIDGILYSSFYGPYLWRSDGTPCGTFMIPAVSGSPSPINFLGDDIIFAADNDVTGRELYRIKITQLPESPCVTVMQESPAITEESRIRNYPNPFTDTFTLEMSGDDLMTDYDIRIVNLMNKEFEARSNLKYNESYRLGADLPQGLYLLRVQEGNKIIVVKILKR